jgi:hypothetical protein
MASRKWTQTVAADLENGEGGPVTLELSLLYTGLPDLL